MLLLIDNYDSFTYNLYQYLAELGADVLVRRNDQITLEEISRLNPERIVISPGPGDPDDAGISVEVIQQFGTKVPLLGQIPIDQLVREGGDGGTPVVLSDPDSPAAVAMRGVADALAQRQHSLVGFSLGLTPARG